MMKLVLCSLACCSVFLIGLNAGFFYTWSFTVTQSLDLAKPESAINAMQFINANIRNAWFAAIFFGAPVLLFSTALLLFLRGIFKPALLFFIAFIAVVFTIAVTMAVHVPLNNQLANVVSTSENAASVWSSYSTEWTLWNHLRSTTSNISFGMSIAGLIVLIRLPLSDIDQ